MSDAHGDRPTGGETEFLAGIRVLEMGTGVAVRYCGRLLRRLGALVERRTPPFDDGSIGGGGNSGRVFGAWLDDGKGRSRDGGRYDLVLAGQDSATIAEAAAIVDRLDDDPTLVAIHWFSPDGPYATWPANDEIILALSGLPFAFGEASGPPTLAQGHTPQILAGANACGVALATLLASDGQRPGRVDVEILESTMCLSEPGVASHRANPRAVSMRLGVNRFLPTYPCSSIRAADGWVGITCLTPAQWTALCEAVGRPELAVDPAYATALRRLWRADEVDAALAEPISRRTADAWLSEGLTRRIPITPMHEPGDLPHVDHWRRRGTFAPVASTGVEAPTLPFRGHTDGRVEPRWAADPAVPGPLSGLRVLDLTMGWAGPLTTRTLADLGADVVKVESAARPDWWRGWEAARDADPPSIEIQPQFNATNRNKRGVDLDLRTDDGREAVLALVAAADVVIDNFAAGVTTQLGLSADVLRHRRPGLVNVSMPAFGQDGPFAGIRAYGSTVEQASGLPFVNGRSDWVPSLQHVAFGDPIAGVYGVIATLAALVARPRLGGSDVDLAQVACLFELGADAIIAAQLHGGVERDGNRRARSAPSCVVATSETDEWLAVAVDDESSWLGLCDAVATEGRDDPQLRSVGGRKQRADELESVISAWASTRPAGEAADHLRAHGVPAAVVRPAHVLAEDPHLTATGFWQELDRRHVGRHLLGAPAFRIDGERPPARRPAPLLGEHTADVLHDPNWQLGRA